MNNLVQLLQRFGVCKCALSDQRANERAVGVDDV
jgi:hypothetical protein